MIQESIGYCDMRQQKEKCKFSNIIIIIFFQLFICFEFQVDIFPIPTILFNLLNVL